jgi:CheY-like chemotaxis protein
MTLGDEATNDSVDKRVFLAMSRDLFFGMRTRTVIRKLGHELTLVDTEEKLLDSLRSGQPSLVIIDFNQPVAWERLRPLLDSDVPVIAFGAHTDVDAFRAARAAGVDRVTSNGDFSRRLPELIESYAKT